MDEKLFFARVNDAVELCYKSSAPQFLGFLTETETAKAQEILCKGNVSFRFFGGYDEAQRVMLGVFPEWCEAAPFPIRALTFSYRECDVLSHRDFLGSVMALGVTRETVGDILVESGRAVMFVTAEMEKYISSQIEKVGRVGVSISQGFTNPLPQHSQLLEFSGTIASARLDCVVAEICSTSRAKAAEMIESALVSVNSVRSQKITRMVENKDKVTVKGKAKFIIDSISNFSKKGRIILKYSKYV